MTRRIVSTLFLLLMPMLSSLAHAGPSVVGFDHTRMADGTEVGVWYPSQGASAHQQLGLYDQDAVIAGPLVGTALPLVVMSHGTGGSFAGHVDTAIALARRGFVVAALTHPGDNWQDQSRASSIEDRPAALTALVTFMLDGWQFHRRVNAARIGAFGFSAGGFTVLAAAGGEPDWSRIGPHCAKHPDFYDCKLITSHPHAQAIHRITGDDRIRAIVIAAPALGFAFDRSGLRAVTVPVQLWRAGDDRVLPAPYYADAVRAALPRPPEFHDVPGAGHFDFLAPCASDAPRLPICASSHDFDRASFHRHFDEQVVDFFERNLQ